MYALTLHNIDSQMYASIKMFAEEDDLSLNQAVKKLLKMALEKFMPLKRSGENPFARFSGTWTEDEAREFTSAVRREINEEDWA